MALDHYVSQVHLRRFYAPALNSRKMHAFRKSDGHTFICGAEDVCRLPEGNTNAYLPEPRLVEDFLRQIEPKYNIACNALEKGNVTPNVVFVISGFTAFVMSCSPTAMRLNTAPLRDMLALEAKLLDRSGQIPRSPPELGGKTLSELLEDGTVAFDIDKKYPQAHGISNIINYIKSYGNFHWDILINEYSDTPFFTSDFPVAVESGDNPRIVNRIVPLTPSLAVRICPQIKLAECKLKLNFEHFSYRIHKPPRAEIVTLNRTIVRCAEMLVFYPLDAPWVSRFVSKQAPFGVDICSTNIPYQTGFLSIPRTVVTKR